MIHLALIDDEDFFRQGLAQVVTTFAEIKLIGEAIQASQLSDAISADEIRPDIILFGIKNEKRKSKEEVSILLKNHPDCKIIGLSPHYSNAFILQLLKLGMAACLPKNTGAAELEHAIRQVDKNGFFYPESLLPFIQLHLTKKREGQADILDSELSDREREILQMICEQLTNTEIAEKLNISYRTVEWHRTKLLRKLNCKNTAGLVAVAIIRNLVPIDWSQYEE